MKTFGKCNGVAGMLSSCPLGAARRGPLCESAVGHLDLCSIALFWPASCYRTGVFTPSEAVMLVTNIELVPGKKVTRHLGLVQGSTVRAKHAGKDLLAGLKNIVGGELTSYTELLNEAREEALERMVRQAEAVGANAVLNVRFSTSAITQGAAELLAYG